jgi:hypothetical protein
MEFLFKSYRDQPSRAAVKYTYDFQAVRAYEQLFTKQSGIDFEMRLEPFSSHLKLTITSRESGMPFQYPPLEYKKNDIYLLQQLQEGSSLQFLHVYPRAGKLLVARPFKKELFINITRFEVLVT